MKRKRLLISIAAALVCTAAALAAAILLPPQRDYADKFEMYGELYPAIRTSMFVDYIEYLDYGGLLHKAETIAIVTPKGELRAEDSLDMQAPASQRQFWVEQHLFKKEEERLSEITVTEPCELLSDGSLVRQNEYLPMLEGHYYMVFLDGNKQPIQDENGVFDLSAPLLNERLGVWFDVFRKLKLYYGPALLEYEPELEMTVKRFTKADIVAHSSNDEFQYIDSRTNWSKAKISTAYTDRGMELTLYHAETDEAYLFKAGEYIYSMAKHDHESHQAVYEDIYPNMREQTMCYIYADYDSLCRIADTIALVTPNEELDPEKAKGGSHVGREHRNPETPRQVTALRFIKNELGLGEQFEMTEDCALGESGTLYYQEDYYPMQMGNCYLIFMKKGDVVSSGLGCIDLANLRLEWVTQECIELLYEWGMLIDASNTKDLDRLIDGYINSGVAASSDYVYYEETYGGYDWQSFAFTTEYTDPGMEFELEYAEDDEAILYRVDGGTIFRRFK